MNHVAQDLVIDNYYTVISVGQDIPALYGAPVKISSPLPVVMFSHGVAGMRTTYSATCCDLASHGYLVAAIEHRSVIIVCACVCVCLRVCVLNKHMHVSA